MAKAFIEPIAGILRVCVNDDARYGDKFYWSATVRYLNQHEIEICAYVNEILPSTYKAVFRECQRLGIRRIFAVNYPEGADGPRKERWFEVPTKAQQMYAKDLPEDK